jgi:hypothetical protein
MDAETLTISGLATAARRCFDVIHPRDKDIYTVRDGSPDWITEMVDDAHGSKGPDDWTYHAIVECLDCLAEDEDTDGPEPDVYTSALTDWLGSRIDRTGYCDDAAEELGQGFTSIVDFLQAGQAAEYREILDAIRSALEAQLDADTDEDETD